MEISLAKKTFKASFWTVCAHGSSQGIRFIGNLLLTRILVPADFGLMQLVFVFIQAINMFSDLGLGTNLVQHHKAEDPLFLRTSWTLQFIRGILIELLLLLAAIPIANLYEAPLLAQILPVAGLCCLIEGFASTNLTLCYRKLELKKVYMVDLFSQTLGTLTMLIVAWYSRSVWALVVGALVNSIVKTSLSHWIYLGPKMQFCWYTEYLSEIVKFGRWIFVSSIGGFLLTRSDKIILGLYLSLGDLGLYGLAWAIASVFFDVIQTLGSNVLVPLYSHLWKHASHDLKPKIFKVRSILITGGLAPLSMLALWGPQLIHWLYPKNYSEAGWMLQILAIAFCVKTITATLSPFLFAVGNSFRSMVVILSGAIIMIISMLIGGHYWGEKGILWAIPVGEALVYPLLAMAVLPYGIWMPWLDFIGFTFIFLVLVCSQHLV